MFCKTFRTKLSTEGMNRFKQFVKNEYKPLISRQPGFKGAYFCIKEESNEFSMIMLWEHEHNIHDWTDNPDHQKISAGIKDVFINDVYQDIYEVGEIV